MSEKITLFDRFGGTRKMADHLDEPSSTVHSWKRAGRIPAGQQPKVLEKARELGIEVEAEDVIFPLGRCHSPDRDATATFAPAAPSAQGPPDPFVQAPEQVPARPCSGASQSTCSTTSGHSSSSADSPSFPSSGAEAA